MSRRDFMATGAAAGAAGLAATGSVLSAASPTARTPRPPRDTLIFVFLRGGMDGLTVCPPFGDPDYATLRPSLAIRPPGQPNGAVDLDGFFGLAPAAGALKPAFDAGHLALIHAAGSTDPSRSHFEAMRKVESATPNMDVPAVSGWCGRFLNTVPPVGSGVLRGLVLDPVLPLTMAGGPPLLPVYDPSSFSFHGSFNTKLQRKAALQAMYQGAPNPVGGAGVTAIGAIDILENIDFAGYQPSGGAAYPNSLFASRLRDTAALIKAGAGVEVIEIDYGAWDHHDNQGPIVGTMAQMLDDLSKSLAAFYLDIQSHLGSVSLVAMSEFGRRVDENGSGGTDHGRGGLMFAMGGNVQGGQVITNWPTLAPGALDDFAVPVTTDYRDVLAELLTLRMGAPSVASAFPGHQPASVGVFR